MEEVDKESVLQYINGQGPITTFWHLKFGTLTGFYRFAMCRRYVNRCPLPAIVPKRPSAYVPYIYTAAEMRLLLGGIDKVCAHAKCKLDAKTFRTLLLLLWGSGLRVGEALNLTLSNVDLPNRVLTIRDTKFYKSRLVPIDPKIAKAMTSYAQVRRKRPRTDGKDSPFFTTPSGNFGLHILESYFRKLCNSVGVVRTDGARYQPRLHDIRHAFATTKILSWYEAGMDVQKLLPSLSTYMGHGSLNATQRYLSMTPEVLRAACSRFEKYALEVHDE